MKKRYCLILVFCLLLLTGCGAIHKEYTADTAPAAEPEPSVPVEEIPEEPSPSPLILEADNSFRFTAEGFPRIDGSTSSKPLADAVASVFLGIPREEASEMFSFNKTTSSFWNLMDGDADILIVGEPEHRVFDRMAEENFEYEIEEIATDALVFIVNENNPVDNLTTEQLRGIYSGEITNWKQVGGNDQEIKPFQRNESAGSQTLMLKLVMGDTPLMEVPKELMPGEMSLLTEGVRSYDRSSNAIGYTVYISQRT